MDNKLLNIAHGLISLKKKSDDPYLQSVDFNQSQEPTSQAPTQDHTQTLKLATNLAVQSGADPGDLVVAKHDLGLNDYIGLCEKFVEQATKGATGLFASAKDAWNGQQNQAQTNFANINWILSKLRQQ